MGDKKVKYSKELLQGIGYEYLFASEAMRRDLIPEQPVVPVPWDFTITHPTSLQSLRVQVKGTNYHCTYNNSDRYCVIAKCGAGNASQLDRNVVDVLACYVQPFNAWYNIPVQALKGKSMWLYPNKTDSLGQYECWKYDWSVYET